MQITQHWVTACKGFLTSHKTMPDYCVARAHTTGRGNHPHACPQACVGRGVAACTLVAVQAMRQAPHMRAYFMYVAV